jgi:curli biogenesis system outer membrane secretion channel CsgG
MSRKQSKQISVYLSKVGCLPIAVRLRQPVEDKEVDMHHWKQMGILGFSVLAMAMLSGCENMKNIGNQLGAALPGAQTSGVTTAAATSAQTSNYDGPRARLAVLRFTDATGGRWNGGHWYSPQVGEGMARKLSSALLQTKRFRVLNRKNMDDMMAEIGFGGSGAVTAGSAARFGKMLGARLVVTAAITDFEENTGGTQSRTQTPNSGLLGVVGGLMSSSRSAYMAVNVEVVDVETSELVASEQVEAKITDTDLGAAVGTSLGLGDIRSWERMPRGKALQEVINKTVAFLAEPDTIPSPYFTEAPASGRVSQKIEPDTFALQMQGILKNLGYYSGVVDGSIGPKSQEAIRQFQQDYDLEVTGALDPPTRKKLLEFVD